MLASASLVFRRSLDMINNKNVQRGRRKFQFKSELLLKSL